VSGAGNDMIQVIFTLCGKNPLFGNNPNYAQQYARQAQKDFEKFASANEAGKMGKM